MSWEEYEDLRVRANSYKTKYVLYTLDIKGSKNLSNEEAVFCIDKTIELLKEMVKEFKMIEEKFDRKILVKNSGVKIEEQGWQGNNCTDFACNHNPNFVNGDLSSFYFYNNEISEDLFKDVFNKCAKLVGNNYEYHLAICNYETNNYELGGDLYWVGYAQQYLNVAKNERIAVLKAKEVNWLKHNEEELEK